MQTFFRLAAYLGQRKGELEAVWPLSLPSGMSNSSLALTASDRISVHFADDPVTRDTTTRVTAVLLTQQFPDTLALRSGVLQMQSELEKRFGQPDECADPLGPPSHMYAPQTVSRLWKRAVNSTPLHLTWEVTPTRAYVLAVHAGRYAASQPQRLACTATLP